jgi:hypothetical protein
MTTPSFSLTATQPVLPRLALDFTTASLDPRITFTRAGNTATVVNNSGNIAAINADLPRFDYDPITLACRGLLIEEARTNLALNSQNVGSVSRTGITFVADAINSPDGTQNADSINESTATSGHQFSQSVAISAVTYTYSVFIKWQSGTTRNVGVFPVASSGLGSNRGVIFNSSGAFVAFSGDTGANPTYSVQSFNNGWYRFSVTVTATSAGNAAPLVRMANGTTVSYAGNVTQGLYVWGWQLEAGAFPTSYIPTTSGSVLRNADVATMTGTDFSDWYNANQGTFRVDAISRASGICPIISADDNTANESLVITTDETTPKFIVTDGGSEVANVSAGTITANTVMFAYVSYDANYFGIARPTARQVDTSGTVPTVDRLRIGANQAGNYMNGSIQKVQFWP